MALTPNTVVSGARAGLIALAVADALLPIGVRAAPMFALMLGYAGALAGLLAFPRVRRGDVLAALAAGLTLRACLPAFASGTLDIASWFGGLIGVALAIAPQVVSEARRLAASNAQMPFSEWRTVHQRRRRGDRSAAASTAIPARAGIVHQH